MRRSARNIPSCATCCSSSVRGKSAIAPRMGGNIVTASPIGDSAPVLLALDAKVVLASAAGERTLPIEEFFVSYRKTALQPGEILKSIIVPRIAPNEPIDPQVLQSLQAARDGHQHRRRLLSLFDSTSGTIVARATRLRRRRRHAGPRAQDRSRR